MLDELQGVGQPGNAEPAFLRELRIRAAGRFSELGFPTPRLEEWRFTNLRRIVETPYAIQRNGSARRDVDPRRIAGAHRLAVVDGRYRADLSEVDDLPHGAVLMGLGEALSRCPELLEPHLGRLADPEGNAFAMLNSALFPDGVFLWLPAGVAVERPIHLMYLTTSDDQPRVNLPRNLVMVGSSAQAAIVETYDGGASETLTCPVTEIVLAANASLDHHVLHREGEHARHVANRRIVVARDAHYRSHTFHLSGELVRNDVNASLDGEGAHVELNGLYVTEGSQHVDNQLTVRHQSPRCTSEQLYKGILDGVSRAVFNGRIVVAPKAQKTNAEQSNRNLLLSDGALVQSNPQLEIFADDVRCTHGSAVGRLDEDSLFYLRSRGIDKTAAESLLTYAFAADVLRRLHLADVRNDVERHLFEKLPHGDFIREAV